MSPTLFASRILFHLAASRKGYKGGKGVTTSVYTQWEMVRSIELLPKKRSQVSLPCIVFVSDRCQALSLVEQTCPAIRLLFVQITP